MTTCTYKNTKGKNKGQLCDRQCTPNSNMCSSHTQLVSKLSDATPTKLVKYNSRQSQEFFNKDRCEWLISHEAFWENVPPDDCEYYKWILQCLKLWVKHSKKQGSNWFVDVTYCHSNIGRYVARITDTKSCNFSAMTMPQCVRDFLYESFYWDIDMQAAHNTITYYYWLSQGKPLEHSNLWFSQRDDVLEIIQDKCEVSRKEAKVLLLSILYGGDTMNWFMKNNVQWPEFQLEIQQMQNEITDNIHRCMTEELSDYLSHSMKIGEEKGNKYTKKDPYCRAWSYWCQTKERLLITWVWDYFLSKGMQVGAVIHDGCHVSKNFLKKDIDIALREIEAKLETESVNILGFYCPMKFSIKPMNPSERLVLLYESSLDTIEEKDSISEPLKKKASPSIMNSKYESPEAWIANSQLSYDNTCIRMRDQGYTLYYVNNRMSYLRIANSTEGLNDRSNSYFIPLWISTKQKLVNMYEHVKYYHPRETSDNMWIGKLDSPFKWIETYIGKEVTMDGLFGLNRVEKAVTCPKGHPLYEGYTKQDILNLWRGFYAESLPPIKDDERDAVNKGIEELLELYDYIFMGQKEVIDYYLKLDAMIAKYPGHKVGVAPFLRSELQGVGKTTLADLKESWMGSHCVWKVKNLNNVFGNFNGELEGKVYVFCDEFSLPKSLTQAEEWLNLMKNLLTCHTDSIVRKGKDEIAGIPSFTHWEFATNEFLPKEGIGRRDFFFDHKGKVVRSAEYWNHIHRDVIKNERIMRAWYDMLIKKAEDEDLWNYDFRSNKPVTAYSQELLSYSQSLEYRFMSVFIKTLLVLYGSKEWKFTPTEIFQLYAKWNEDIKNKAILPSAIAFGRKLTSENLLEKFCGSGFEKKRVTSSNVILFHTDIIRAHVIDQELIDLSDELDCMKLPTWVFEDR